MNKKTYYICIISLYYTILLDYVYIFRYYINTIEIFERVKPQAKWITAWLQFEIFSLILGWFFSDRKKTISTWKKRKKNYRDNHLMKFVVSRSAKIHTKPYTILHFSGTYIIRRISGPMEIHQDIISVSLSAYHLLLNR